MVATWKVSVQNLFLSKLGGALKVPMMPEATTTERSRLKPSRITACSMEVTSLPRRRAAELAIRSTLTLIT